MSKRALISVSDKAGIVDLARQLIELDFEILSTGGTADLLKKEGLPVTLVSDVTGFPECLDGRVKTLHPAIHGGILARRGLEDHMEQVRNLNIGLIDVVVINLYPFKATAQKPGASLEDVIEQIDIGGPAMIRSAAKNHEDVFVLVDPSDYPRVLAALANPGDDRALRYELAVKVFRHTAAYDALISSYLAEKAGLDPLSDNLTLTFEKAQDLRYGENPHQNAVFYRTPIGGDFGIAKGEQLHGKELSYNNIADADAAMRIIREFEGPAAVAVKHANPCGVGLGYNIQDAFSKAYEADPVSIFGGIIALNRTVDLFTARMLEGIFLEIILAPDFEADALELLKQKKNIRLMKMPVESFGVSGEPFELKKVTGGLLVQDANTKLFEKMEIVTDRIPTDNEMEALKFAWQVVKHVKSNAIVLTSDGKTVGIGPGQVNRIGALEIAIKQAAHRAKDSVMASDAYFPFQDCVETAAKAGITAIIQPGGSVNDQKSIDAANQYGIAMVFTGTRHFNH